MTPSDRARTISSSCSATFDRTASFLGVSTLLVPSCMGQSNQCHCSAVRKRTFSSLGRITRILQSPRFVTYSSGLCVPSISFVQCRIAVAEVVVPSHSVGDVVARTVSSYADCRYPTGSRQLELLSTLRSTSRAQKCKRSLDQRLEEVSANPINEGDHSRSMAMRSRGPSSDAIVNA